MNTYVASEAQSPQSVFLKKQPLRTLRLRGYVRDLWSSSCTPSAFATTS